MRSLNKNINLYSTLLILELFILISTIFFTSKLLTLESYIIISINFVIIAISFYTKPQIGKLSGILAIVAYSGLLLYMFFAGNLDFSFGRLIWLLSFPTIGITSGKLKVNIRQIDKSCSRLDYQNQTISKIDQITGLYNKQKFYEDLLHQTKKPDCNYIILFIQLLHYGKLVSICNDKVDKLIKSVANIMPTEKKYRISEDTIAVLFQDLNVKTAKKMQQILYERLGKLTLNVDNKFIPVKFIITIEPLEYDTEKNLGGQVL